jgi:aldehyde:ferredoxin oxidoreductase
MVIGAINDALGTALEPGFFRELGRDTLRYEAEFNREAGFTEADDELPDFFYEDALEPSNKVARFHAAEVNASVRRWWQQHAG